MEKTKTMPQAKKNLKSSQPVILKQKDEVELKGSLDVVNSETEKLREDGRSISDSLKALKEFNPELYDDIKELYNEALRVNKANKVFYNKYQINKALIYGFKAYDRSDKKDYFAKIDDILGLNEDNFIDGKPTNNETIEEYLKVLEITTESFFRRIENDPDDALVYVDDKADLTDKFNIDKIYHIGSPTKLSALEFSRRFSDYAEKFPDEVSATFAAARELGMNIPDEYRALLNLEDKMISIINSENKMISSNKARVYLSLLIIRSQAKKYNWIVSTTPVAIHTKAQLEDLEKQYADSETKLAEITKKIEEKNLEFGNMTIEKVTSLAKSLSSLPKPVQIPLTVSKTPEIESDDVENETSEPEAKPVVMEQNDKPIRKLKEGYRINAKNQAVNIKSGKLVKESEAYEE